jgi:hypothetical protein
MYRHVCTLPAAALLAAGITILTPMAAWATDSGDVATLALANAGKGAGLCSQVNPAPNSLGGAAFGTSCTGNQGEAEYWCADFAKWVWQNAAGSTITDTGDLDAGAVSFYNYGVDHGTLHTDPSYRPQVGDAVIYDVTVPAGKSLGTFADHVGLVSAVNPDGSIETVNGDFGGVSGYGEAYFSETSTVQVKDIAANEVAVGSAPPNIGMTISGYSTPVGLTPSSGLEYPGFGRGVSAY